MYGNDAVHHYHTLCAPAFAHTCSVYIDVHEHVGAPVVL